MPHGHTLPMDEKLFWELFRDTGDIAAFLLYRRLKEVKRADGA